MLRCAFFFAVIGQELELEGRGKCNNGCPVGRKKKNIDGHTHYALVMNVQCQ
jgi:hypothetical protein